MRYVLALALVAGCAQVGPPVCVDGVPTCGGGERPVCLIAYDDDFDGMIDGWGPRHYLVGGVCTVDGFDASTILCNADGMVGCMFAGDRPDCLTDEEIVNAPGEC